jgi:hypothetical protein
MHLMSHETFCNAVATQIEAFERNGLIAQLDRGDLAMVDYRRMLQTLFHQVRLSSTTFAMAATHLPPHLHAVRAYLFRHAHEEADHWRWIVSDLEATGGLAAETESSAMAVPVAAYVGYNFYIATAQPLGRLAIASVLEGIGGRFGSKYARRLVQALGLRPEQLAFLMGHSESDAVHSEELKQVLVDCVQSDAEWLALSHIAATAGALYTALYEHCSRPHG